MDRAARLSGRGPQVRAGCEVRQFGAGAGAHPAEALRRSRRDSAKALGKGPGQSRVRVRHGDARDADEGLGEGRAAARGIESRRLRRRRRRRILPRAGRRGDRPLRARAGALQGRSGWRARLVREAARRGDARQARTPRRGARATWPSCRRSRASRRSRCSRSTAQLLRDAGNNKAAYEILDERARPISRRARSSLRPRDGRREARPDRCRSRRSSRAWSSSSPRMRTRSMRSVTRSSIGRRASPKDSR